MVFFCTDNKIFLLILLAVDYSLLISIKFFQVHAVLGGLQLNIYEAGVNIVPNPHRNTVGIKWPKF